MSSTRSLALTPLPRALSVAVAGAVLTGLVLVDRSVALLAPLSPHPLWTTTAATLDLTVTASLAAWWMLRRDFGWSARALVALFLGSLMLAGVILPQAEKGPLEVMHLAVAPLELVLMVWLFRRVLRAQRRVRARPVSTAGFDVQDAVLAATADVVGPGRLAEVLADEMTVLYYALARRPGGGAPSERGALTYHRKTAYGATVFALVLAALAEVPAMHLLLSLWSHRAAWITTALGLYAIVWLIGDWRACRLRPVRVEDGVLRVRFGLRWRVDVPLEAIAAMRGPTAAEKATRSAVDLRLALPGASWAVLELDRPATAVGMYGRRRSVRTLGLGLDEPAHLSALLSADGAEGAATDAATTNSMNEGHA